MTLLITLIGLIPGILLLGGTAFYIHRSQGASQNQQQTTILNELKEVEQSILGLIKDTNSLVSLGELEFVGEKISEARAALTKEKETLGKIESTLGEAQREVELKETEQQELKIAKENDSARLDELKSQAEDMQNEASLLEQSLQESLKDLNRMIEELEENSQLRLILEELSLNIESAASLLGELEKEHKNVGQRLTMIAQQQSDLEEEYTRLVEQQLNG